VEEGATVPNNAEIAVIDEGGAAAAAPAAKTESAPPKAAEPEPAPAKPAEAPAPMPDGTNAAAASAMSSTNPSAAPAPAAPAPAAQAHGPAGSDERAPHELPGNADARMTPAVRRLLREHGLTAAMIVGTGGGGRITREDVTDFVESQRTGKPVGRQNAARGAGGAAAA